MHSLEFSEPLKYLLEPAKGRTISLSTHSFILDSSFLLLKILV